MIGMKLYYAAGIVLNGSNGKGTPGVFHDLIQAKNDDDADRQCISALMKTLAKSGVTVSTLHSYTIMPVPSVGQTDLLYGVALLVVKGLDEETGSNESIALVCTFSEGDDEDDAISVSRQYVLEKHGKDFEHDNAVIHSGHALPIAPTDRILQ